MSSSRHAAHAVRVARCSRVVGPISWFWVTCTLLSAACQGEIGLADGGLPTSGVQGQGGGPAGGGGASGGGTVVQTAPAAPMRRVSHFEYNHMVHDLLGTSMRPADQFVNQDREAVFDNNIDNLGVSEQLTEQYLIAAEALAAEATQPERVGAWLGCDAASAPDDCVRGALAQLARRAYRRPVEAAEVDDLMATYQEGKSSEGTIPGLQMALARLLVSPFFLYWEERGAPGAEASAQGQVRLTSYEVAARMARMLIASLPDEELLQAAASGQLETPEQRLVQARRLLRDAQGEPTAAARANVDHFHAQWLELDRLDTLAKSDPAFDASLREAMRAEIETFLGDLLWNRRDTRELFQADASFVNEKLASIYGISGVSGPELSLRKLDGSPRAGLLTQPGILALTSSSDHSKPVQRASYILRRFLCAPPGDPPANAPKEVPDGTPGGTHREKFEALTSPPACASCHAQINGIGFSFDQFDAIGRFRTVDDDGQPLNTQGELLQTDVDGKVKDGVELARRLGESAQVRACLVQNWYRYTSGRYESAADRPQVERLMARYEGAGNVLEEVLLGVIADEEFTLRPVIVP